MDNQPLEELPEQGQDSQPKTSLFRRMLNGLARLGLGETALRFGTNFLSILVIVGVVWLMQFLYRGTIQAGTSNLPADTGTTSPSDTSPLLPEPISAPLEGIARQAKLNTIIPSRPRIDVTTYTVQIGDSLFTIAEKFNLDPRTILWGNYDTLKDQPNLIQPEQVLVILPVDGTYYQWQGSESLTSIAKYFSVEVEAILDSPANHLDPDTIDDLEHPNIPAGTWLVVPGGVRQFTSWSAPAALVLADPSVGVWGPGLCTGITYVQVGYGTFIYPTVEHWLSGTPYLPELGHYAVDFAGAEGNAVYAVDAGTVVYSGWNTWGYGNLVIIDHGNGWESRYAHLSQINVGCGQSVGQGDMVGLVGMTGGTSTGPHLHFELVNATYGRVNPLNFLPAP